MARLALSPEAKRLFELNGGKAWQSSQAEAVIGPAYPEMGGTVAKFRRVAAAAGSIAAMSKAERWAYGEAVEKAIKSKQRAALLGAQVVLEGPCREIGAKIRAEQKAALSSWPAKVRAARSARVWESMYEAAMAEKWAAAAPEMKMAA